MWRRNKYIHERENPLIYITLKLVLLLVVNTHMSTPWRRQVRTGWMQFKMKKSSMHSLPPQQVSFTRNHAHWLPQSKSCRDRWSLLLCGRSKTLMGRLDPSMPGIPSTFVFSHAVAEALLFPSHACSVESHAAVGLFLHLPSSSGPGSSGRFPQRCSDTGI